MKKLFIIALFLFSSVSHSQNLFSERIRKLDARKRSVYLESGIFHNGGEKRPSSLKGIRHSFSDKQGFERVVADFTTDKLPRIYGHISSKDKKLYLDLFDTDMTGTISSFGNTKYVKAINFFPITEDSLSVEIVFKENVTVDVFYLTSPARLVIDIKK